MSDKKKNKGRKKKKGSLNTIFWLFIVPLGILFPPTFLLFLIGMLPTWVAWIADPRPQKYSTYCVGAMNVCGVLPYALKMWDGNASLDFLAFLLRDVQTWFFMFGSAAIGWGIFIVAPLVALSVMDYNNQIRAKRLAQQQKRLVTEWGDEILPPGHRDNQSSYQGDSWSG